jgi:hypothetical protein
MKRLNKKPIQIYLDPQQNYALTAMARDKGISKAEIIRESLDRYLREIPVKDDPAMGIIGLGNSGKRNLSEHHDAYIADHVSRKGK